MKIRSCLALGTIFLSAAIVSLVAPSQVKAQTSNRIAQAPPPIDVQRPDARPNNRQRQTPPPPSKRPKHHNRRGVVPPRPQGNRLAPRPQGNRPVPPRPPENRQLPLGNG